MFNHYRHFLDYFIDYLWTTKCLYRMYIGFRYRSLSSVGPVFNITENVVSSFRRVVFAADSTYAFWRRHSTPVFLLFGKYIFQYYFNVIRDLSYKYPFLLTIYYVCYSLEWVVQILARAEMLKYYIKQS